MNIIDDIKDRLLALAGVLLLAVPGAAAAQIEVEADPFAYAMSGFSLHLAKVLGPVRVNVGTFGIDVPEWIHGNEGWDERMRGAGVKVDYLGSRIDGFFVGVDGGYMRNRYVLTTAGEAERRRVIGIGARGGYRLPLGSRGLYVSPWVGVSYNFNGDAVAINGEAFDRNALFVFPTVHVGWRF